ncbi:MAG TPA: hypothetical protein VHY19_07380 [Steroidobacteraceae bacterium]|jgi:hypothetical protein|nr:hypothetical protein [Steroidobacteraceae bacterium]
MRYIDFIEELRILGNEGGSMIGGTVTDESQQFRDWRYRLEEVVAGAYLEGYKVPGTFKSRTRHYRVMGVAPISREAHRKHFDTDMGDTLRELQFIVDRFERYGVPDKHGTPPVAAEIGRMTPPSRMPKDGTLGWLIDNISWSGWAVLGGLLLLLFLAGFAVGQFPTPRTLVCHFWGQACFSAAETGMPRTAKAPVGFVPSGPPPGINPAKQ